MIKFAVTRPKERIKSIQNGIAMLKWHEDPFLSHYGVRIDPNMTVVSMPISHEQNLKLTLSRLKLVFSHRPRCNTVVPLLNLAFLGAGISEGRSFSSPTLCLFSLGAYAFLNTVSKNLGSSTLHRFLCRPIFRMAAKLQTRHLSSTLVIQARRILEILL